jgi:hypothetical protein
MKNKNTIIINLFGGPGVGKSTGAAYIFAQLKLRGINCEYVSEFAKDKVWEESKAVFQDQLYIFGKQHFKISRCHGKVDVIVTDSPLLLSKYYNSNPALGEEFNNLVEHVFNGYENYNYLLHRVKPYSIIGRFQTEEQAEKIDEELEEMLANTFLLNVPGDESGYETIITEILQILNV